MQEGFRFLAKHFLKNWAELAEVAQKKVNLKTVKHKEIIITGYMIENIWINKCVYAVMLRWINLFIQLSYFPRGSTNHSRSSSNMWKEKGPSEAQERWFCNKCVTNVLNGGRRTSSALLSDPSVLDTLFLPFSLAASSITAEKPANAVYHKAPRVTPDTTVQTPERTWETLWRPYCSAENESEIMASLMSRSC